MRLIRDIPRRDLIAIVISIAGITLLSWLCLVKMAADITMPGEMSLIQIPVWDTGYFAMMFLMWAVMMVGMMLPSVTPMVLLYAGITSKAAVKGMPNASTGAFVSGYFVIWFIFSLFATIAQWGLVQTTLLSPTMGINSAGFGAILLITAGIYQWLPIKEKCLQHCRSPVHYISNHWHPGTLGAFRMGLSHGTYCLGCCWVLMTLLFVGGVMNLLWVAAIMLFILLEKVLPFGDIGGRAMGLLMIIVGGVTAFIAT